MTDVIKCKLISLPVTQGYKVVKKYVKGYSKILLLLLCMYFVEYKTECNGIYHYFKHEVFADIPEKCFA